MFAHRGLTCTETLEVLVYGKKFEARGEKGGLKNGKSWIQQKETIPKDVSPPLSLSNDIGKGTKDCRMPV